MSFVLVGAALIGAGGAAYAANRAGDAQQDAVRSAERSSAAGLAAQNQATRQQLELARPLVETRDNALRSLQVLFGLPVSSSSDPFGAGGRGSNGSRLVALNGLSTVGQHSAQTNRSTLGSVLDPAGLNLPGPLAEQRRGGAGGAPSLFYDPGANTIVDGDGNLVYNVPEGGGVIEGLRHGYNNQVRIDSEGNLTSVGSRGENPINIRLQRQTPEQTAAAMQADAAPDRNALLSTLMNTPGIRFVDEQGRKELEQMMAARGLRRSGAAFEAGIQRASDLASTNYTNLVLNPLFQLAGFGQQGAGAAGNALAQQGQNVSANQATLANLALQSGNARASSYQQTGQTVGDLASNLAGIYARNGGSGGTQPKAGTVTANKPTLAGAVAAAPQQNIYNDPFNNPFYGGN